MCSVLVVLVKLSVLAKWLARKTPLRKPNCGEGIISKKPRLKSGCDFLGLLYCFIVLLHCMLASGAVYCNRSCLCCVFVAGGWAVSEPYYNQRAQCLSERLFHYVFVLSSASTWYNYFPAFMAWYSLFVLHAVKPQASKQTNQDKPVREYTLEVWR